ncbi:lipoyl(octanoyl) transferase LipB [Thiohalophilus sp.]|uniref:lipoyl(octanoyl) transferase LipB n=1 Tax=Thiohalophilus sp. TaxID=3028392 RepID=UPI002ACEB7E8|nr:lipoyl(octanoyl) transferase LipB [Thiohalophilus sp.]MDZ7803893.1 lipoyl(octanoyl) transferase LipB [Thiohalophilus sp.]
MSQPSSDKRLRIRLRGLCDYEPIWHEMQAFTQQRQPDTPDELWLLQHPPVFTLGRNAKPEHLLDPGDIPVIPIDRGGQVTYHGPGQLMVYILADLKRLGMGIREFVSALEQSVIDLLAEYQIAARGRRDAPGVYVQDAKIAALGLRVKQGCTYHGLALNIDMDLSPFSRINPCGYAGMAVTQMRDLGVTDSLETIRDRFVGHLLTNLGYNGREQPPE